MPRVGKESFPYTAKGKKAAKAYAKESGQEVEKYENGGIVHLPKFPKTAPVVSNTALRDANKMGQELRSISLEEIPTSNAMQRRQISPMGDEVGTGMYKKGGKVK